MRYIALTLLFLLCVVGPAYTADLGVIAEGTCEVDGDDTTTVNIDLRDWDFSPPTINYVMDGDTLGGATNTPTKDTVATLVVEIYYDTTGTGAGASDSLNVGVAPRGYFQSVGYVIGIRSNIASKTQSTVLKRYGIKLDGMPVRYIQLSFGSPVAAMTDLTVRYRIIGNRH